MGLFTDTTNIKSPINLHVFNVQVLLLYTAQGKNKMQL